jgi:type IV secretory pathway VirB10-like protein
MNSRSLAGLLVAGCVTAAAGGAYVAVRQNAASQPAVAVPAAAGPAAPAPQPVSETEALVGRVPSAPGPADTAPTADPAPAAPVLPSAPILERVEPRRSRTVPRPEPVQDARAARRRAAAVNDRQVPPPAPANPAPVAAPPDRTGADVPIATPVTEPVPEPVRVPEAPPAPPEPQFEEVVLPASSVVGLKVETPLSSERARIEDRVDARVTRDVTSAGRVAIPAGSRVIGSVTLVERGGKVKERARLGVRFHTLVLADGREVPLRTEAIFREGDSPANESARKIGGAAIGGAILGAIMGGGKGAVVGGAAGAAGGSAVVMAGDRNAATLPAGTVVTVRLSAPATIEVEKREQ